jgi:hypothetical protein
MNSFERSLPVVNALPVGSGINKFDRCVFACVLGEVLGDDCSCNV